MSASTPPPPRKPRKPRGKPLPLTDTDLDRLSVVGPDDAEDTRAWWRRGNPRSPLRELLSAGEDDAL
jgi:hypothetical protein